MHWVALREARGVKRPKAANRHKKGGTWAKRGPARWRDGILGARRVGGTKKLRRGGGQTKSH